MSVLAIMRPMPISILGGTLEGVANLSTPDPKEAALSAGGSKTIDIDLGSAQLIDTVYVGFGSGTGDFALTTGTAAYTTTARGNVSSGDSNSLNPRYQFIQIAAAPYSARYIRLTRNFAAGETIATLGVGLSFRPTYGREYGSGRGIDDTGTATRNFGGGFNKNPGVTVPYFQWTLGDLLDAEVETLFAIAQDRGETNEILVIEDPDFTDGLNERIHWGLFGKIEAYDRFAPGVTRWGLRVNDWR